MTLPNQLSALRIILTPVFVTTFYTDNIYLKYTSFAIFIIASLTDYYDGFIARRYGITSNWGRFLDPLADKILISSALIVFALSGVIEIWMVLTIIIRDAIITALRTYAMFKGKPIVTSYLAKAKTFSQITIIYLVFIFILLEKTFAFYNISSQALEKIVSWNLIPAAILFVTILTIISGIKYMFENRDHIKCMILDFYRAIVPSDL